MWEDCNGFTLSWLHWPKGHTTGAAAKHRSMSWSNLHAAPGPPRRPAPTPTHMVCVGTGNCVSIQPYSPTSLKNPGETELCACAALPQRTRLARRAAASALPMWLRRCMQIHSAWEDTLHTRPHAKHTQEGDMRPRSWLQGGAADRGGCCAGDDLHWCPGALTALRCCSCRCTQGRGGGFDDGQPSCGSISHAPACECHEIAAA